MILNIAQTIIILFPYWFYMGTQEQHKKNAALEKRFMTEAREDEIHLYGAAQREANEGHRVRARFLMQEAEDAGSWLGKRQRRLVREERLAENKKD